MDLYYEVWNEPDVSEMWTGTTSDYYALYAATVQGAKRVDPLVNIGGPATSYYDMIPGFISFARMNNLPIDFISWHTYPGYRDYTGTLSDYANMATSIRQALFFNGFSVNTPLVVDEWNHSGANGQVINHDTEFTAAYVVSTLNAMRLAGITAQTFFQLQDFVDQPIFGFGSWGAMNTTGTIKPVYNAFRIISKFATEGSPYLLSTSYQTDDYLTALASTTEPGTGTLPVVTRILLSHYVPSIDFFNSLRNQGKIMPTRSVTIKVSNLVPGYYFVRKYLVDRDYSNSCSFNKATEPFPSSAICGTNGLVEQKVNEALTTLSPPNPSWFLYFWWIDQINNNPRVALQQILSGQTWANVTTNADGTYQESVALQPYSVFLIELIRVLTY